MVLGACKAEGSDLVELDALKVDVKNFKKWAEDGLAELGTMALQESMKDNMQEMLAEPKLNAAIRNLLKPKDQGKDGPAE